MAKQSGIFKVEGTLDDVTFVKRGEKYFVKKKGGVSRQKIMSSGNFARTRENISEFGEVARAGKILRSAGAPIFRKAYDPKLCNRLFSAFTKVKNLDTVSERGARKVGIGLATAAGKDLLKQLHFNDTPLNTVLFAPYSVVAATGVISIPNFVPQEMLNIPANATQVGFCSAFLVVDFETGLSELGLSPIIHVDINMTSSDVVLTPAAVPTLAGIKMHFLLVAFYQEINGAEYALNDGGFNVVGLVGIE